MLSELPVQLLNKQFNGVHLAAEYEKLEAIVVPRPQTFEYKGTRVPRNHTVIRLYNDSDPSLFPQVVVENAPYTIEVIQSLKDLITFNFVCYRTLPPRSTFGWHIDEDITVNHHIPVITGEGAFFVSEDTIYKMHNIGSLYKVDSNRFHTFVNATEEPRVHMHFVYDADGFYQNGSRA